MRWPLARYNGRSLVSALRTSRLETLRGGLTAPVTAFTPPDNRGLASSVAYLPGLPMRHIADLPIGRNQFLVLDEKHRASYGEVRKIPDILPAPAT